MSFKLFINIGWLGLFLSLTSCEDFFETTLELDPPPFEKTLVIDCVAHAGLDTLELRISRNAGILENIEVEELGITDAEVVFSVNGNKISAQYFQDEFQYQNRNNFRAVLSSPLKTDDVVLIEVNHKDFEKATSLIRILPHTEIFSAVFTEDGGLDREGEEKSKVTVKLKDQPGKNFYAVQILAPDWNDSLSATYVSSLDPAVFESYQDDIVLLTDDGYDGKEKTIDFQIYRFQKESVEGRIKLVWYNISEDFYKYSRSLLAHKNTADNPFGTPVPVTTNIEGGTGIFAIHSQQIEDIK